MINDVTSTQHMIQVKKECVNTWNIVKELTETIREDPFYVCDIGEIVNKYSEWKEKLPRVVPHYAVKCNDSDMICKVLCALGSSFDCASKGEIIKILDMGVNSERIIFANPCKPISHIKYAASRGVELMTFDNEVELHKLKTFYPTAKLVLRIRCDATVSQCPLGMKFGCLPDVEGPHLLKVAAKLGLNVVGISFHVGSGCGDPPVFRRAISSARKLFDFAATLGYNMELLDIGGGFPGNKGTSIDKIAEIVNLALDDFFPDTSVRVIAEPGRFMVASCYTLATNVHSKRSVRTDGETHHMYYINDGVYGSFNCILYDHAHVTPIPLSPLVGKLVPSSVWGPTCDGLDQVCDNVLLPELHVGDWIIFEDMGAYTLPVASTFNGFPLPRVHHFADEHIWSLLKNLYPFTVEESFVSDSEYELTDDEEYNKTICQPINQQSMPYDFELVHC